MKPKKAKTHIEYWVVVEKKLVARHSWEGWEAKEIRGARFKTKEEAKKYAKALTLTLKEKYREFYRYGVKAKKYYLYTV